MKKINSEAPFQSIANTARITGLSTYYIRNGCKAGTIPHIRCGRDYRVNVPLLLKQLEGESQVTE